MGRVKEFYSFMFDDENLNPSCRNCGSKDVTGEGMLCPTCWQENRMRIAFTSMTENRLNERPEFGNERHIQMLKNTEEDVRRCYACREKVVVIRDLKLRIEELERTIKILSRK